ncbi:NAD(P)-dependent alcohol dehydrogenase [Caulobacter sp. 1776]|uniref:zinc-dependent alcohol dehydrogenase family protein n=1 Tax=Caulobacter sp. 1776 TaxID=3156420 RepID=UPI003391132D
MHVIELARPDTKAFQRVVRPDPAAPGDRQVLVRMRAASLNFIDVAVVRGHYPAASYPNIPVADGAGEVVEVGAGVTHLKAGDRVAIHPKAIWVGGRPTRERAHIMRGVTVPGSLTEYQLVDAATAVRAPDHLTWAEIAALPITFTTGWSSLKMADINAGATIVVLGTGGASLSTLQLAKAQGARVIVTSSSDDKIERAKALGADAGVNYRTTPDWHERVLDLTDGVGADLVFEAAGTDTFPRSIKSVRQGGTVFTIGFRTGGVAELDLMAVIVNGLRIIGTNTGSADDLREAVRAVASTGLRPVIAQTYGLDQIEAAYEAFAKGEAFGKTVFDIAW